MGREDRFSWDDGDYDISQCVRCRHKVLGEWCTAFPQKEGIKIPLTILLNEHDHRQAWPGDHGIRFEHG